MIHVAVETFGSFLPLIFKMPGQNFSYQRRYELLKKIAVFFIGWAMTSKGHSDLPMLTA